MNEYFHKDFLTVIIKPTDECNGDCAYCAAYDPNVPPKFMTDETLYLLFDRLEEYVKQTNIKHINLTWHGGEPLLMGPGFYEKVYNKSLSLKKIVDLEHSMQSNLTLYNDSFVEIFEKLDMSLGSSVDPFKGIRLLKPWGEDHFETWIKKVQLIKDTRFFRGGIIVIHKHHLDQPEKIFKFVEDFYFFTNKKQSLQFNYIYNEGRLKCGEFDLGITDDEWADFLIKAFNWWNGINRSIPVQPLDALSKWYERNQPGGSCQTHENCAAHWIGIDPLGNVYNCGVHMDTHSEKYGNIYDAPFSEIVLHPDRIKLYKRYECLGETECKNCRWLDKCTGGCPEDGKRKYGDRLSKAGMCKVYNTLYNKLYKTIEI